VGRSSKGVFVGVTGSILVGVDGGFLNWKSFGLSEELERDALV
jgi:hypothetical protein